MTWAHRPHGVRTRGKKSETPVLCREMPTGCFCSTGHGQGAHAFDNCKLLSLVCPTQPFTFANCVLLQRVMLPYTLHTIHSQALMNCAALQELAIPPSLHHIACKAFLDCTVLRGLARLPSPTRTKERRASQVSSPLRPTCPHLHTSSELTQARTLVLDLCLRAPGGWTGGWNPGENLSSWPEHGSVPCQPCTKWANDSTLALHRPIARSLFAYESTTLKSSKIRIRGPGSKQPQFPFHHVSLQMYRDETPMIYLFVFCFLFVCLFWCFGLFFVWLFSLFRFLSTRSDFNECSALA